MMRVGATAATAATPDGTGGPGLCLPGEVLRERHVETTARDRVIGTPVRWIPIDTPGWSSIPAEGVRQIVSRADGSDDGSLDDGEFAEVGSGEEPLVVGGDGQCGDG